MQRRRAALHRARATVLRVLRLLFGDPARFELAALVLLVLAAAAGWTFVEIADEVLEQETRAWDRSILLAMRSSADVDDPLGPGWFEDAMRDVTALGSLTAIAGLTLFVVGLLFLDGRRAIALLVAVAVSSGVGLSTLLKQGFDRPRPDLVSHAADVYTSSFPSGHSMVSAVAYLSLGALLARTQARLRIKLFVLAGAFLLTGAIGTSRVYLGVHWPSDVLAGWAAGASWASLCWFVAWRLQVIGAAERER